MDDPGHSESRLADTIDLASRRIATALFVAGAVVGLAVYARPGPPRYQVEATETGFLRIDGRRGTVLACDDGRCHVVLRRGQRLDRAPPAKAAPAGETKALPAPAGEPAVPEATRP